MYSGVNIIQYFNNDESSEMKKKQGHMLYTFPK